MVGGPNCRGVNYRALETLFNLPDKPPEVSIQTERTLPEGVVDCFTATDQGTAQTTVVLQQASHSHVTLQVRVDIALSMVEIYNDNLYDLLQTRKLKDSKPLDVREERGEGKRLPPTFTPQPTCSDGAR
jgi:hypothetical protein